MFHFEMKVSFKTSLKVFNYIYGALLIFETPICLLRSTLVFVRICACASVTPDEVQHTNSASGGQNIFHVSFAMYCTAAFTKW